MRLKYIISKIELCVCKRHIHTKRHMLVNHPLNKQLEQSSVLSDHASASRWSGSFAPSKITLRTQKSSRIKHDPMKKFWLHVKQLFNLCIQCRWWTLYLSGEDCDIDKYLEWCMCERLTTAFSSIWLRIRKCSGTGPLHWAVRKRITETQNHDHSIPCLAQADLLYLI